MLTKRILDRVIVQHPCKLLRILKVSNTETKGREKDRDRERLRVGEREYIDRWCYNKMQVTIVICESFASFKILA